jgi:hypothetical protein
MEILAHNLGLGIVLLQSFFKPLRRGVAERVVLVEDIILLFLLPDLTAIIGETPADLLSGVRALEAIAAEIRGIVEFVGHPRVIPDGDLVFVAHLIDDLHHVAAGGSIMA